MAKYFDTLRNGLVPVSLIACAIDRTTVTVKVLRNKGPWKAGETIDISRHAFVEKAYRRSPHQYVREAPLSTLPSGRPGCFGKGATA